MNFRALLRSGWKFLLRRPAPISIGCVVTHRCNLHCEYCDFPAHPTEELSTEEWKGAIDELARAGTIRFGFTGGEALLRQDIGELIGHAANSGATVTLCSNGILLPERLPELSGMGVLVTSLDAASPQVHDARRGPGSFEKAMRGIEAALSKGISTKTLTVLSAGNLDQVPGILDLADELGFRAGFQPASYASLAPLRAVEMAPPVKPFHDMIRFLLEGKRQGRNVLSSSAALQSMLEYPTQTCASACEAAGKYFGYVDPRGAVFPCHFGYNPTLGAHPSGREMGYVRAFEQCTQSTTPCSGCYIVPLVEMNMLFGLRASSVWEQCRDALFRY